MATFYLDFENGDDALDGTTFANRWKTITNGATSARTAAGDVIRIMGSPAPTSLGQNGVWTSQELQGTKNISSSTNATPISVTGTAHGYSTGDTVVITGHGTNTNANGTWEITVTGANTFTLDGSSGNGTGGGTGTVRLRSNTRVMLTTAVTQNIASTGRGRAAWTASANVTTAFSSSIFKEHNQSDSIVIAAAFTTGLAAYWALPSTLDLSAYQQVSFWIYQTSGTVGNAGAIDLRLCSDNAGVTAVNTISIPNTASTGRWTPITVDLGTALGSSIQSIALYVNTDNGAQTILLNNIIACKASSDDDSLTLTSLIGKNVDEEGWWCIQSINGNRIMLDGIFPHGDTPTSANVRGYYGTSETVTTWKRETIKLDPSAPLNSSLGGHQAPNRSALTFSGGWDRTSMTTQNLETWLDNLNANQSRLITANAFHDSIVFDRLCGVRCNLFIAMSRDFYQIKNAKAASVQMLAQSMWSHGSRRFLIEAAYLAACDRITAPSNGTGGPFTIKVGKVIGSINATTLTSSGNNFATIIEPIDGISEAVFANSSQAGLTIGGGGTIVKNVNFSNTVNIEATCFALNCLFNGSPEVSITSNTLAQLFSHNHDQTPGNSKIFLEGGLISSATDQRHTASGISWKIQPTSSTVRTADAPVILSLAKVACAADSLVTIKAWMRRTNTGLTMRLVCKGGQIAGVVSDVTASMTAAADTWAEQTITFTPTEAGVVEITAEAWGGTTHSGWVDDLTISQA